MLDRRYKYSLWLTSPFYLYRKYKRSGIFYVRFKDGKTISTHSTDIQSAYDFATNYLKNVSQDNFKVLDDFQKTLRGYYVRGSKWIKYDEIHGSKYSDKVLSQNRFACEKMADMLQDVKDFAKLSKARLHKLQEQLLENGLSGKSVNNYIAVLHKIFKQLVDKEIVELDPFVGLRNCSHEKQRRTCFPIDLFRGFFEDVEKMDSFSLLAYCAIITGARRTELMKLKIDDISVYKNVYILRINGTKSEYSVRSVPLGEKGARAVKRMIAENVASLYNVRKCTEIIGGRIGYSLEMIKNEGICFHSFRKMYKTILTAANLNTSLIETLMGHSTDNQSSNDVERIYFVSDKADMSQVYKTVIDAFKFLEKK